MDANEAAPELSNLFKFLRLGVKHGGDVDFGHGGVADSWLVAERLLMEQSTEPYLAICRLDGSITVFLNLKRGGKML